MSSLRDEYKSSLKESKHSESKDYDNPSLNAVHQIIKKRTFNFLIAVDGSEQSHDAFLTALSFRRKYDHITVFHAYKGNVQIDLLPLEFRYQEIKLKYEVELVGSLLPDYYDILIEPRKENSNALSTLKSAIADENKCLNYPDFVFLGQTGRKGRKDGTTSLGQTADLALRTLHLPCFIIKQVCTKKVRTWVMAVDGSVRSEKGLDILLQLVNPKDTLILLHFYSYDDTKDEFKQIKTRYERELEEMGPVDSQVRLIRNESWVPLGKSMADVVNDIGPDYFALAPRARQQDIASQWSSLTEYLIRHVQANVLLCKN